MRVSRLRRLAPGRNLADEGQPLVELADPVDELFADWRLGCRDRHVPDPTRILDSRQPAVAGFALARRSNPTAPRMVELAHRVGEAARGSERGRRADGVLGKRGGIALA